jgi:hypothetical protein
MVSRTWFRALLVALALVGLAGATASSSSHVLTGKMAWWQQVVGFWGCEVNLDPSPGQYVQKGFTIGEGSVAPDNVFHWSDRASGFEADAYNGYDTDKKVWWETQSDSTGYASVFHSLDGLTYEGSPAPGSGLGDSRFRETYSMRPNGTFYSVVKRLYGGSWHAFSEASCKRITATPRPNTLSDSSGIGPRTTTYPPAVAKHYSYPHPINDVMWEVASGKPRSPSGSRALR